MTTTKSLLIEHDGNTYHGRIAKIRSTSLGFEDHGVLSVMLHCEWEGGGIGVGGFCLDQSTGSPDHARRGTAYGLDHIIRVMESVGVSSWEKVTGASVVVLFEGESVWGATSVGIAGLHNDKVLILKDHAQAWLDAGASAS